MTFVQWSCCFTAETIQTKNPDAAPVKKSKQFNIKQNTEGETLWLIYADLELPASSESHQKTLRVLSIKGV